MRKVILSFAALSALFAISCSNSDKNTPTPNANTNIVGTWNLTGMQVNYYNSSNQIVSKGDFGSIYGNRSTTKWQLVNGTHPSIQLLQAKFTNDMWFSCYAIDTTLGVPVLGDSSFYALNTSANPMTLNFSYDGVGDTNDDGMLNGGGMFTGFAVPISGGTYTIAIPLLTSSQMVLQITGTPSAYQDTTTNQTVDVAYSITLDTLTKQQ